MIMGRHAYGAETHSIVYVLNGSNIAVATGGLTITFWTDLTGGTQYTNLSADGTDSFIVDHVVTSDGLDGRPVGSIPFFYGPDNIVGMWAEIAGGPRLLIEPTDTAAVARENTAGIVSVQSQITQHVQDVNPHGTTVATLTDTNIDVDDLEDGLVLTWDSDTSRWVPASVEGVTGVMNLAGAQTVTGSKTFGPITDVNLARIIIYAEATGQVADLLTAYSGTDTGQGGTRQRTFYLNEKGELRVIAAKTTSVPVSIKGQTSQTANITEWTDPSGTAMAWVTSDGRMRAPNTGHVFALSISGEVEVGSGQHRIYNDTGSVLTIRAARATVGTTPDGADLIVDVNKNGTSIFTTQANRPKVLDGNLTSGKVTNMNVTTLSDGDYLTVDVDQIGSVDPGADLVVQILAS